MLMGTLSLVVAPQLQLLWLYIAEGIKQLHLFCSATSCRCRFAAYYSEIVANGSKILVLSAERNFFTKLKLKWENSGKVRASLTLP